MHSRKRASHFKLTITTAIPVVHHGCLGTKITVIVLFNTINGLVKELKEASCGVECGGAVIPGRLTGQGSRIA